MTKLLNIQLDSTLEQRLQRLSEETDRSVRFHAKLAIREYLDDKQDCALGIAALERNEPRMPLAELERKISR